MALSDKNQNLNPDSGQPAKKVLWSRIVHTNKTSLLHSDQVTNNSTDGITRLKSLIFKVGRSPGSIMFDVTCRPESQKQFFHIIATQLPERWGVLFHLEGNRKIIEVHFLDASKKKEALKMGLLFPNDKICILPTDAVTQDAKIVRLSLTHLPFLSEDEMLMGLRASLKKFGHVLDVGISRESECNTYIGQGYAVLDVGQTEEGLLDNPFEPLHHNIPWWDSNNIGFRATWHNMPPYCTYCHDFSGTHIARQY